MTQMIQFVRTIVAGVKQGAIAAWDDMRWYIIIMGTIAIVWLAYRAISSLIRKIRQ